MRGFLWLAAGLALIATGLWLAGRSPSAYVLEQECVRFHEERRARFLLLTYDIGRLEKLQMDGADVGTSLADLRTQREELLLETKRIAIRGWDVLVVPPGAPAPPPGEMRSAGRFAVGDPDDPPALKGRMEVRVVARGLLARVFSRLGG